VCLLGASERAARADDETEGARSLFQEAGELELQGQWGAAQERLRQALRLRETPHLHYALGWALENDDKLLEAKTEYDAAVRLGRERAGSEDVTTLATSRLSEIDRKTARVKPGSHVIRIERSDRAVESPRSEGEPRLTARRGESVVPWLFLSGGIALLVGSGALLVSAGVDADASDRARARWCTAASCTGTTTTSANTPATAALEREASDAVRSGSMKQSFGLAMAGVGVVSAVAGVILLVHGGDPSADKPATRAKASVAPLPGGGVATGVLTF
jgi:hypothetical protein